jgi:hypothetical protein
MGNPGKLATLDPQDTRHKTQDKDTRHKTQDEDKQTKKYNTVCVGHHYGQTNVHNVNKTSSSSSSSNTLQIVLSQIDAACPPGNRIQNPN